MCFDIFHMRLICIELCSVQHEKCRMCEKCSAECRFDSHVWVVWINNAMYVIMCMIARCQLSMHNSLDCQLNLPVQQLSAGLSVCLSVCLYVSVCLCVSMCVNTLDCQLNLPVVIFNKCLSVLCQPCYKCSSVTQAKLWNEWEENFDAKDKCA